MNSVRLIASLVLVAPLAVAMAAFAKDKGDEAAAKPPVDPNRQVCRRVTPTGSMMSKKVCQTKAQWSAAEAHASEQMSRNRQLRGSAGQGGGQ